MDIKLDEMIGESQYFTWREALFLPRLNEYYWPNAIEIENIKKLACKLDRVRDFFKTPFKINVWIRPINFKSKNNAIINYNAMVGGAKNSAHISGSAVDGYFFGLDIDSCIKKITPFFNNVFVE